MQRSALCRSRRELSNDPNSNAYFLAKFGLDTAENQPASQPRTSLVNFARSLCTDRPGLNGMPGMQATVGVDVDGDGRADFLMTGIDRNGDGIPDVMQPGLRRF